MIGLLAQLELKSSEVLGKNL